MNSELPVTQYKEAILASVEQNSVTIIVAETGAGKSTQVPQYLIEAGYDIVVTQPRRLAVRTVSARVAEEVGCQLGGLVGYKIRGECVFGSDTKCLFATDGLAAVRELMGQGSHNVLVIDEVHEWNMNIEVLVAWVKLRLTQDIDFKVVLMSATLEAGKLSAYFDGAPIINVPGRLFPVEVKAPQMASSADEARLLLEAGHNVLIFEPGKAEIGGTIETLKRSGVNAVVLPLHGEMDSSEQRRCFASYPKPKCIVSTNVAETSVTIPDITAVVDGGMERRVEVVDGVEGLYLRPISKANAKQRQGRAGRCAPGVYIDRCDELERPEFPVAEINRLRLDQTVLRLAQAGFDMEVLSFFHQPKKEEIRRAKASLLNLGCLTEQGEVTPIGEKVALLPISVNYARMVVEAEKLGVVGDVITIAAILEGGEITARSDDSLGWHHLIRGESGSDLIAQLMVYKAATRLDRRDFLSNGISPKAFYRVKEIRTHLCQALRDVVGGDFSSNGDRDKILKSVCAGMVDHLYSVSYGQVKNGDNITRQLNKWSVVRAFDGWVIGLPFDLPVRNWRGERVLNLVRMVSVVDPAWFVDIAPQLVRREEGLNPTFDLDQGCVITTTKIFLGVNVIQEYPEANPNHPQREEIRQDTLNKTTWLNFINGRKPSVSLETQSVTRFKYGVCARTGKDLIAYGVPTVRGSICKSLEVNWFKDADEARTELESALDFRREKLRTQYQRQQEIRAFGSSLEDLLRGVV